MVEILNTFTHYISLITAFQLFSFAIYLFFTKRKDHLILGLFLVSNALYIFGFWLQVYSAQIFNSFPDLFLIGFPFGFLFGPLIYLYTNSLLQKKKELKFEMFYHSIPFILVQIFMLLNFHIHSTEAKLMMINDGSVFPGISSYPAVWGMYLSCTLYIFFSLKKISDFKAESKENLSSLETHNIGWLQLIVWGFLLMWGIDITHNLLRLFQLHPFGVGEIMVFLSLSINLIFANLILFKGLSHPELLNEDWISKPLKTKYEASSLELDTKNKIAEELKSLMEREKPYLEPDLTLNDLAKMLAIHPRTLSQVINEKIQMSFYDFVNGYRINDACNKLTDPEFDSETILGILLESGFNSKSVFNSIFKKNTGLTPSEYRKKLRRISA